MSKHLTKRQAGVYLYIYDYIQENHYPPTVREIADAFQISSTNGVVEHLKALGRKGFIEKDSFKSRAIRPLVAREKAVMILDGIIPNEVPTPAKPPRPARRPAQTYAPAQLPSAPRPQMRLLGNIACGSPIYAEENFDNTIEIDPNLYSRGGEECYALRVRGTSMIGDGIRPGDIVVVRPQKTAEDGELIAAMIDGSATVKRYEKRKGLIYLVPSNPDMEPIVIHPEDNADFQILGSIRGVLRIYQ